MQTTIAYSVNDDDMHWMVFCPNCNAEQEWEGYFDSSESYKCECGTEFRATRMEMGDGSYIE